MFIRLPINRTSMYEYWLILCKNCLPPDRVMVLHVYVFNIMFLILDICLIYYISDYLLTFAEKENKSILSIGQPVSAFMR